VAFRIEQLTRRHDREAFDCGEPTLNEYLRRYARQNQEQGIGRTFVAVPADGAHVVGYYTLAAGSVQFANIPADLRRRLPRYPVPVAHLGRLATCLSVRGQGLGGVLLYDALQRVLRVAEEIGVVAVEVHAKAERARQFYERYGFESLTDDPLHLYLPLATVRRLEDQP
jgi:GNAT superfamily N-acetyltransferase